MAKARTVAASSPESLPRSATVCQLEVRDRCRGRGQGVVTLVYAARETTRA